MNTPLLPHVQSAPRLLSPSNERTEAAGREGCCPCFTSNAPSILFSSIKSVQILQTVKPDRTLLVELSPLGSWLRGTSEANDIFQADRTRHSCHVAAEEQVPASHFGW